MAAPLTSVPLPHMAEDESNNSTKSRKRMTMKLLIDKTSHKVLFAEANKEVVDFLFGLLTLPVGTVTSILNAAEHGMVGCIGKLHESFKNIDETYIQQNRDKNDLLLTLTAPSSPAISQNHLLLENHGAALPKKYYKCQESWCEDYVADVDGTKCPRCNRAMTREMAYVVPDGGGDAAAGGGGGFVKGVVTYMVLDDLSVEPLSMISVITLLSRFSVRDVSNLEERIVELSINEGLKLLNASLKSKTPLTDAFLVKKEKLGFIPVSGVETNKGFTELQERA